MADFRYSDFPYTDFRNTDFRNTDFPYMDVQICHNRIPQKVPFHLLFLSS
ncbi:MAG: pentapeptide repeat-containing protein [Clostridia bacterium]|nr:pentapeptide repeat-containing protein [Clostridia bacterium]